MMPSILQLIEKLHKRQLNYLGLTNTGLTEEMFGAILEKLKSYKLPALKNDQETRAVLELNRGSSLTISLTQKQYQKFLAEGERLQMDIRMSQPRSTPIHLLVSIASRNKRQERRSLKKAAPAKRPRILGSESESSSDSGEDDSLQAQAERTANVIGPKRMDSVLTIRRTDTNCDW